MDIDGLGEEVAIQLVDSGLVKSIPDLYRLTKPQLLTLDKFADQRAQNLLNGIARSKDRGLARLLAGLSIYMAGRTCEQKGDLAAAKDFYQRGIATAQKIGDTHAAGEITEALAAIE